MSILGNLGLGLGKVLGGGVSDSSLYEEVLTTGVAAQAQSVSQKHLENYYNQALNNQLQQHLQPQWVAAQVSQANVGQSPPQPMLVMNVAREKLQAQIHELVKQLPMSIAGSVQACGYYERDPEEAARFVVVFSNGRKLTFYDVDAFPSSEHIGRIALECP